MNLKYVRLSCHQLFTSLNYSYVWSLYVKVSCAAHSEDEVFDLSSLTLLDRSHRVLISPDISDGATRSATYYINICHPVSQQDAVHCPLDAAVCREDTDGTTVVSCSDVIWLRE